MLEAQKASIQTVNHQDIANINKSLIEAGRHIN